MNELANELLIYKVMPHLTATTHLDNLVRSTRRFRDLIRANWEVIYAECVHVAPHGTKMHCRKVNDWSRSLERSVTEFRDGKQHGTVVLKRPGELMCTEWRHGVKHGECCVHNDDDDHVPRLVSRGRYENGEKVGLWEEWEFVCQWSRSGGRYLTFHGVYGSSERQTHRTWSGGKLLKEISMTGKTLDGPNNEYFTGGRPKFVKEYRMGKKSGEWCTYFTYPPRLEAGIHPFADVYQKSVSRYDGVGRKTGEWISCYTNGRLRFRGSYVSGRHVGAWIEYTESGRLSSEGTYDVKGKKHGEWRIRRGTGVVPHTYDHGVEVARGAMVDDPVPVANPIAVPLEAPETPATSEMVRLAKEMVKLCKEQVPSPGVHMF